MEVGDIPNVFVLMLFLVEASSEPSGGVSGILWSVYLFFPTTRHNDSDKVRGDVTSAIGTGDGQQCAWETLFGTLSDAEKALD